jgi:hypothetical protein
MVMSPPQRDFIGAPQPPGESAKVDLTLEPFHSRPNGSEGYDEYVKRLAADHARLVERHNTLVRVIAVLNERLTKLEPQKQPTKPRTLQELCHHVTPRVQMRLNDKGFEEAWCTECDLPIMENER